LTDSATAGQRYSPSLVIWLSVGQLVSWGSVFYLFALLVAPLERDLGLSRTEISLAFSLALLAEGLAAYPVGRWIDRGHERLVMTGGSLLAGLALVLHSQVSTAWGLYAVWLLLGVAMAAVLYSPAFAVLTRRFSSDFRRAIITLTFLGGLASTVFIPLIAWLMGQLGWRGALLALAMAHWLLCAPLHWRVLRGAVKPSLHLTAAGRNRSTPASVSELARGAPFVLIGLFVSLMMSVTVALPAHMVSLLREYGLAETWVIALPAAIGVIQVAGRLMMYLFEHHMNLHRVNQLVPMLIPLGLLALLVDAGRSNASVWLAATFVLLYGLGNGMLTIVRGTVIALYVSRAHAATLNGVLGIPQALARAAAPLLLGVLWSPQVGYRHGLWLMLALSLLSVAALISAQRLSLRHGCPVD
jgi:MFS family permease